MRIIRFLISFFCWVAIFVVGSLILTLILSPYYRAYLSNELQGVYYDLKDNFKSEKEYIEQVETYTIGSMQRCDVVDFMEFNNMAPDPKRNICEGKCSERNREYYSSGCERGWFMCYCVD